MIVLDIESSGLHTDNCGIWQIGAIDLEKPSNYFLQEGRIDDEDLVEEGALKVIGKTEKELRNPNKQSQKQLILNCLEWVNKCENKLILGHNVGWDLNFIQNKCMNYEIMNKFREALGQRGMDLHTTAQNKYLEIYAKHLLKEKGSSDMNLTNVLKFCGIPDKRIRMKEGAKESEVEGQGTPHNALEDCKLEGECFYRLIQGKNLFPEYSKYKIPEVLKK